MMNSTALFLAFAMIGFGSALLLVPSGYATRNLTYVGDSSDPQWPRNVNGTKVTTVLEYCLDQYKARFGFKPRTSLVRVAPADAWGVPWDHPVIKGPMGKSGIAFHESVCGTIERIDYNVQGVREASHLAIGPRYLTKGPGCVIYGNPTKIKHFKQGEHITIDTKSRSQVCIKHCDESAKHWQDLTSEHCNMMDGTRDYEDHPNTMMQFWDQTIEKYLDSFQETNDCLEELKFVQRNPIELTVGMLTLHRQATLILLAAAIIFMVSVCFYISYNRRLMEEKVKCG